jgi:hypothetical protein
MFDIFNKRYHSFHISIHNSINAEKNSIDLYCTSEIILSWWEEIKTQLQQKLGTAVFH